LLPVRRAQRTGTVLRSDGKSHADLKAERVMVWAVGRAGG